MNILPSTNSSDAPLLNTSSLKETLHPTTEIVKAALNTSSVAASSPPSRVMPLPADADIQTIKQYVAEWGRENYVKNLQTAKTIILFLNTLQAGKLAKALIFDDTTFALPNIFHTKIIKENLTRLEIHSNNLEYIPSNIKNLKNLMFLDLSGCSRLTQLPEEIGEMEKLILLNCNDCISLMHIPQQVDQLNKLVKLGLNGCHALISLPDTIKNKHMADGHTLMTRAVTEKNMEELKLLKRLGSDVNCPGSSNEELSNQGATPLLTAIYRNDQVMANMLIKELGANVNQSGGDGTTPLVEAASKNNLELVKLLIKSEAFVNQATREGMTAMDVALWEGNAAMVVLLEKERVDINSPLGNGETPLTRAVSNKKEEIVQLLIEKLDADINQSDATGQTPMTTAVIMNDPEMVHLLNRLGKEAASLNPLNQAANDGHTPLTRAVMQKNLIMLRLLHTLGAEINYESSKAPVNPLTLSISQGNLDAMECLINELHADVNQHLSNGATPLTVAIDINNQEAVKLLKKLHPSLDLNQSTLFDETPLGMAVIKNNPTMLRLLHALGANINQPAKNGETPFATAILYNLPAMKALLTQLGANQEEGEEIVRRKFIAHVWGIAGQTEVIKGSSFELEGLIAQHTLVRLNEYVSEFFASDEFLSDPLINKAISKSDKMMIQESLNDAFPLTPPTEEGYAKAIEKIHSNKPVVILGGVKGQLGTLGHGISIVLHKNQLIICNRGLGMKENAVEAYNLNTDSLSDEQIKEIIEKLTTMQPNIRSFKKMIKALPLEYLGGYVQKPQKVENCAWASSKGALGILCRLCSNQEIGKRIYKKFTNYARQKSYNDYINLEYKNKDHFLINAISSKRKNKSTKNN